MPNTKQIEFDKFYDDLCEEDILFYSLKYCKCKYKLVKHKLLGTLIEYEEPDSWPAFYTMDLDDTIKVGVFTSKTKINLAYIKYNKEQ